MTFKLAKIKMVWGLPRWNSGKEFACQCKRRKRHSFNPWVRKIPWSRKWQPTPVFLPAEAHGQRSLVGHSPWGHKSQTWLNTQSDIILYLSLSHLGDWGLIPGDQIENQVGSGPDTNLVLSQTQNKPPVLSTTWNVECLWVFGVKRAGEAMLPFTQETASVSKI